MLGPTTALACSSPRQGSQPSRRSRVAFQTEASRMLRPWNKRASRAGFLLPWGTASDALLHSGLSNICLSYRRSYSLPQRLHTATPLPHAAYAARTLATWITYDDRGRLRTA